MARAMNARQVRMFTSTLSPSVAMVWLPNISPSMRYKNETATPARLERTMIIAITAPHPPSHPRYGPKALVVQVNEVPASGATLLNSL
jgi:hypothetical protein